MFCDRTETVYGSLPEILPRDRPSPAAAILCMTEYLWLFCMFDANEKET